MSIRLTPLLVGCLVVAMAGCNSAGSTILGPGSTFAQSSEVSTNTVPAATVSWARPFIGRGGVSASNPTLENGVASGTAGWNLDLSQGASETLIAKLYEGSKVVATAKKTVHGPSLPFTVTARYTCKGATGSSFHTYAIGTGYKNQKVVSETVTLACNE